MRTTIARNVLKHAVGRALFCPTCSGSLDYRKAVLFENGVACGSCWDKIRTRLDAKHGPAFVGERLAALAEDLDYIDGRTL